MHPRRKGCQFDQGTMFAGSYKRMPFLSYIVIGCKIRLVLWLICTSIRTAIKSEVCSTMCHLEIQETHIMSISGKWSLMSSKILILRTYIKHCRPVPRQDYFQSRRCKIGTCLCIILSPVCKPASIKLSEIIKTRSISIINWWTNKL